MTTTTAPARTSGRTPRLDVPGPGRSTTRRLLLGLLISLLILSVLVFASGLLAFVRVHDTADAVRNRTAPAIGEIAAAKSALLHADRAAAISFKHGAVQFSGPGDDFQNQIAVASQSLTRAAEHNTAGEAGTSILQLIEGLLVTYIGLVEQADAHFRQPGGELLGLIDLWSASRQLHDPDGGIVTQLDALRDEHTAVLDRQLAGTATTPVIALVLFVPVAAMLVLLLIASLVFHRRFRRRVNLWLVLGVTVLVPLAWISGQVIVSHQHIEATRDALNHLVAEAMARDAVTDVDGQRTLRELLQVNVCDNADGCGDTFARFVRGVNKLSFPGGAVDDATFAQDTRSVTEQTIAASADADLQPLIYVLAILLASTTFLGFRARLNEYRYRPR